MTRVAQPVAMPGRPAWGRIGAIIQKELTLALRNRMTQVTVGITTGLFILIPAALAYGMGNANLFTGNTKPIDPQQLAAVRAAYPQLAGLAPQMLIQALVLSAMQSLFLLIPLMVPMIIAVYSIIGEKQNRSLEAVLATPIETSELLAGKCLAAALPGILSGWVSYLVFTILVIPALPGQVLQEIVVRPAWLLALLLIAPAGAFLAVTLGLIVSSRATDPQAAQQIAGIIVLPVVAVMIGQIAGVVQINGAFVLLAGAVLLAIDAGLLFMAVRLFQRETILTRWK